MGESRTEARSRAFLTAVRGRFRSWQRRAVLARNSFSAAVVSGTVTWERSRLSSVDTARRVAGDDGRGKEGACVSMSFR